MKIKSFKLTKSLLIIACIFSISKTFSQQKDKPVNNSTDTTILSKVEVEASFPGGDIAWNKYVINAFKDAPPNFKNADQGTCRIRFIVDKKEISVM